MGPGADARVERREIEAMGVSWRGVLLAGALSLVLSLFLVGLLSAAAPSVGATGVGVLPIQVVSFLIGALARLVAGAFAGRATARAELDLRAAVLTAAVGCAAGYVVFELLDVLATVAALGRAYEFRWALLYGLVPWVVEGALGGAIGRRWSDPHRRSRSARRAAERGTG